MKHAVTSSNAFPEQTTHGNHRPEPKEASTKENKIHTAEAESDNLSACMTHIGEHIRSLRIEKGYSSAEIFAYEHDLNRVSYWRMEKGCNMTLRSLLNILDIHGLSLKEFFEEFD